MDPCISSCSCGASQSGLVKALEVLEAKQMLNDEWFNALSRRSVAEVRSLLDQNADPNALDTAGGRPLGYAVQGNPAYYPFEIKKALIDVLVEAKADIDGVNLHKRTALHCAAEVMDTKVMEYLESLGADKKLTDREGLTAMALLFRQQMMHCRMSFR